jgi:DNA-binding response OmpR family regulator
MITWLILTRCNSLRNERLGQYGNNKSLTAHQLRRHFGLKCELHQEGPTMPIRVLIADSNEYLLDLYRDYLSQHGFAVAAATNGLDCAEKLREFEPDILVLEPMMPWGGGDGVLALMHKEPDMPNVPVMILTYGCDPSVLYNISLFPISNFQKKPMPPRVLAEQIAKTLTAEAVLAECSTGSETNNRS